MRSRTIVAAVLALGTGGPWVPTAEALQDGQVDVTVVPQSRAVAMLPGSEGISITGVDVEIDITHQVAVTTLEVGLSSRASRVLEAVMVLPVPDDAVVRGFDFEGAALEPTAELLDPGEARATYDAIVRNVKDPALLEFSGYRTLRSSVFPVPANGTQRVRVVYEHVLHARGDRVDYELPRSESLLSVWIPWTVRARIRGGTPVSTVYSPSHEIAVERVSPRELMIDVGGTQALQPGVFQMSYLLEGAGVSAAFFAYPDARVGGGYFLLVAGLPVTVPDEVRDSVRREVIFVLDTSGSMSGEKFDQARDAAKQVLSGLRPNDRFNLIAYSRDVVRYRTDPVAATEEQIASAKTWVDALQTHGGTNLFGALTEALRQDHDDGTLPLVLFLTDGQPTSGLTDEQQIRKQALELNGARHRIFTFGVGHGVNVPLLDALADGSRGESTYVSPGEHVEEKVSEVAARLCAPALSSVELAVLGADESPAEDLVRSVMPTELPDLYEDDQLVLLGVYTRDEPVTFELSGDRFGERATFELSFDVDDAAPENSFVPRLWAARRIATAVDEIRQLGESATASAELLEEVVALSTEYGILTEYTSFLALEGTDLSKRDQLVASVDKNLQERARSARVGIAALNQSANVRRQRYKAAQNRLNRYLDENPQSVSVTRVIQAGDRAFFRRRGAWIDSRLLADSATPRIDRVVHPSSPEFARLADRLVDERRPGLLSVRGNVLLELDGEAVLIPRWSPKAATAEKTDDESS